MVNIEPDPEHVRSGMEVRLTTYSIGTDDEGIEADRVRIRASRLIALPDTTTTIT